MAVRRQAVGSVLSLGGLGLAKRAATPLSYAPMATRRNLEVAYWPNPPGGLPTLRSYLNGRVWECALPSRGWLTMAEVAAVFGVNVSTVWGWQNDKDKPRFRTKRDGFRWLVSASDVARYVDRTRKPTEKDAIW